MKTTMDERFTGVQECIDYRFSQVKLLRTALTHSSYANEQEAGVEDNERLEYLGDAVLELVVSEEAFARYPEAQEGQLTRVRSRLVKEKSLSEAARLLSLDKYLFLGKGEEAQGGRNRDSLLADALEAVFGAVFLDGGFDEAKAFILEVFSKSWPESLALKVVKDHKSRLQEITQSRFKSLPAYNLTSSDGPEHAKVFRVEVAITDGRVFVGEGGSVKKAEQAAASEAVETMEGEEEL